MTQPHYEAPGNLLVGHVIMLSLTLDEWLFDVLPDFAFTTSERSTIISNKHGIYKLPRVAKRLKAYDLRKSWKIRTISKLHRIIALVPSLPSKIEILLILAKTGEK